MTRRSAARAASLVGLLALGAVGLGSQQPTFEVASVKANQSSELAVTIDIVGRRFTATNVALRELIRFAFDVQSDRLIGGPSWIATERYDVNARADRDLPAWGSSGPPVDALLMLRKLLAERFALIVRQETRGMPVYALVVARPGRMGGDIRPSTLGCATAPPGERPSLAADPTQPSCGMRIGPGQMVMGGTAMPQFANVLSSFVRRVVVDRTGLTGLFDFRLSWTPEGMRGGGAAPGAPPLPPIDPNGASIFAAIQEQLGLKLEPQQAPLEVVVIERIERPSPD